MPPAGDFAKALGGFAGSHNPQQEILEEQASLKAEKANLVERWKTLYAELSALDQLFIAV